MATNLEFIKSESVSSSVSSFSVDNCFSDTYNVYAVVLQGFGLTGTTSISLGIRFIDSGGSVISASEYDTAALRLRSDGAFAEDKFTAGTYINASTLIDQSPEVSNAVIYVHNPYDSSSYTFTNGQSAGAGGGALRGWKSIGVHKVAETIRGIAVIEINGSRPFEIGKVSVYGVK
jgi:hypothetical protein